MVAKINKLYRAFTDYRKVTATDSDLKRERKNYIVQIYEKFQEIREFGRKSKGKQDYRQVTVDMCKDYFCEIN